MIDASLCCDGANESVDLLLDLLVSSETCGETTKVVEEAVEVVECQVILLGGRGIGEGKVMMEGRA